MSDKASIRRQILSCIFGNILTVAHGASSCWPVANFLALQKPDSLLPSGPLSVSEAALVMSAPYIGAIVGNLAAPHIARKYGCKRVMLMLAIPQMVISLLTIYAQNQYYLYAASILGGFVHSNQIVSTPIFVSEISYDKIRGALNAFYVPANKLGYLLTFLLANYFNFIDQAKFHLILSIVFMTLFAGVPETPQHLVNRKKHEEANTANEFFKGQMYVEIPSIAIETKNISDDFKLTLSDFTNKRARRAIFLALSLPFLSALQGSTILVGYEIDIFASTNPNVSPIYASMIITTIVLVANLIYLNVVDRIGRRTLYIWSSIASGVGLILFAIYLYCFTANREFDWFPVVCLSYVSFFSFLGMYPIPWLIIMETMPMKIKHHGYSYSVLLTLINGFILNSIYPLVKEYIGLLGWIIVFAMMNFFSAIFGFLVMPETRGKSHEEIMKIMENYKLLNRSR